MRIRWLWILSERMNWYERPPRRLWAAILKWQDRAHGHSFKYD